MSKLEKLFRRKEVERITGLTRSTIYAKMDKNEFPKPVRVGKRAVAWKESDIDKWIKSRMYVI